MLFETQCSCDTGCSRKTTQSYDLIALYKLDYYYYYYDKFGTICHNEVFCIKVFSRDYCLPVNAKFV